MKNNQYLEKYGEKALQLITKKSLKQVSNTQINMAADNDHHQHVQKHDERVYKSNSHKSLTRNSKSKSKIAINPAQSHYTFQKPLNLNNLHQRDKNRKKLLISGLSTPKNNRSARMVSAQEQNIPGSSTKKKAADLRISQKLNDALQKHKSTKTMTKQLLQCLDMISQTQCRISKWINQFKEIVQNIAEQAISYRKKYKQENSKFKKIQRQLQQIQANQRYNNENKKRKPVQLAVIQQNQKLRQKINKLQTKIQNYQRKQIILIETLQKFKGPNTRQSDSNTSVKRQKQKQQSSNLNQIKKQFYGNFNENQQQNEQSLQQSQENL